MIYWSFVDLNNLVGELIIVFEVIMYLRGNINLFVLKEMGK